MRIVRTFHPVGQGAFYTEKLYDDDNSVRHIMVFDCGVAWGRVSKARHLVKHAFKDTDTIDYLFISHLDYDHISLASTLLDSVHQVRHIVLPLISEEDLEIALALHRIAGHANCPSIIEKIISHYRGDHSQDYMRGDYSLIMVGEGQAVNGSYTIWPNGESRQLDSIDAPDWVFIPYNVESVSRKAELVTKLGELLEKKDICKELDDQGETITDSNLFFNALKDTAFVKKVIKNKGHVLKGLKEVYENIKGTINKNSLQLYSGPKDLNHGMFEDFYLGHKCLSNRVFDKLFWEDYHRVACLFTGECDFDLAEWRDRKYQEVWDNVGTIQIPHHGSIDSFDIDKNTIDRYYKFIVSCGNENTFGHPSMRLLEYLLLSGCYCRIVNESLNSVYMRKINI